MVQLLNDVIWKDYKDEIHWTTSTYLITEYSTIKVFLAILKLKKSGMKLKVKLLKISKHGRGAPNVDFRKISVRKTIWDLEFSKHFLQNFLLARLS